MSIIRGAQLAQPTGSFATTGSNTFIGSQTITGSLAISGSINNATYIDFNPNATIGTNAPAWKEGRLFYDSGSGALALYNWEQDVTLNIGQEQWLRARNQTGVTITNGSVVRLVGAIGDRPTIALAQSVDQTNIFGLDNDIIGMATHDIENGTDGFITTFGLVNGLDTSAYASGDLLWVSQSAGRFTSTPPSAPFDKTFVGIVTRANPNNGSVFMTPQVPIHFHDISSVSASAYQMGDLWMYRSGSVGQSNAWINTKQLTGSYIISGSLNVTGPLTGSVFGTSSWANNAVSSSYALTASYALNAGSGGASFPYTGSAIISGSLIVTGSVNARSITGSLLGTSSWAVTASNAITASYALNALSSSFASTASYILNAVSSSFASTASYVLQAVSSSFASTSSFLNAGTYSVTASWAQSASVAVTASYVTGSVHTSANPALSASYALSSSQAVSATTASFLTPGTYNVTSSWSVTASNALTASYVLQAVSSSFASTASYVLNAVSSSFASTASFLNAGTYSVTSSWAVSASNASTASYVLNAVSSSFATTASYVTGSVHTSANPALSASNAVTASYTLVAQTLLGSVVSASYAATASLVNTLNQNVLITGSLTVGSSSLGAAENTLTLGARDSVNEGGQLGLNAPGGTYTSASFIDVYQNRLRILRGSNVASDGEHFNINLHTGQVGFSKYTGSGAFPGSAAGYLAIDSAGNVITATGTGGSTTPGGSNTQIQYNNSNAFGGVPTLTYDGTILRATGSFSGSFIGQLTGTSSWAQSASVAVTASYILNAVSSSFASTASYILNAVSSSFASTASFLNRGTYSVTSSWAVTASVAISASNAVTASYVTGSVYTNANPALSASYALTASYALNGGSGATFPYIGDAVITGSLIVSGSRGGINTSDRYLIDGSGIVSIDWASRILTDASNAQSLDYDGRYLTDNAGTGAMDWRNRILIDSAGYYSINWGLRYVYDSSGGGIVIIDYSNDNRVNIGAFVRTTVRSAQQEWMSGNRAAADMWSGQTIVAALDGAVSLYDLCFLDTDGIWYPVNNGMDGATKLLGICVDTSNYFILLEGDITINNANDSYGPYVDGIQSGVPVYISNTTGRMSQTTPSSKYIRTLGHPYYRNTLENTNHWLLKFRPSNDWYRLP